MLKGATYKISFSTLKQNLYKKSQSNFKNNEKERVKRVIKKYIDLEKDREFFEVIETESETKVDIDGLKFSTRIDRMDRLKDGSKLIIDYKTGKNIGLSKLTNQPLEQAQLPIYAISNEVDGIAFATINTQNCEFKAITKNKDAGISHRNALIAKKTCASLYRS